MENEPASESSTTTNLQAGLPVEEEAPLWPLINNENVVEMTEKSYTDYMDEKRGVVLLFYDSNCPTCRKLAPEYAAAAEMLKGDQAVFGMVDAYESGRGFFIRRYPTICTIFSNGRLSYYNFEESEGKWDAIVTWVKRMITLDIYSITKMEDAERIFNAETHLVLGFVDDLEGPETRELAAVQQLHSKNINFYQTARADVAEFFHIDPQIKRPALIFLERVSGNYAIYEGQFTRVPMANFVAKIKLLLLVTFVMETSQPDGHFEDPPKQLWLLSPSRSNGSDEIISTFRQVTDFFGENSQENLGLRFMSWKKDFREAGLLISDELEIIDQAPVLIGYTGNAYGEKYIFKDKVSSESTNAISETLLRLPSRFLSNSPSVFLFPHKPQGWNLQAFVDYMTLHNLN
ncbi:hypothetical protein ACOSQ3_033353 [Xanthoceras sorbifolium]